MIAVNVISCLFVIRFIVPICYSLLYKNNLLQFSFGFCYQFLSVPKRSVSADYGILWLMGSNWLSSK